MDPSLYLDRDTWVHRLDPRTKMILVGGMFTLPFVFLNPLYELAVLFFDVSLNVPDWLVDLCQKS